MFAGGLSSPKKAKRSAARLLLKPSQRPVRAEGLGLPAGVRDPAVPGERQVLDIDLRVRERVTGELPPACAGGLPALPLQPRGDKEYLWLPRENAAHADVTKCYTLPIRL